jgi:hypothetical protein
MDENQMKKCNLLCLLLLFFFASRVHAIIVVENFQVECKVLDAVYYKGKNSLSLDIEIIRNQEAQSSDVFATGRRFNVKMAGSNSNYGLKINQNFTAHLEGIIADLNGGKITVFIHPESIKIASGQNNLKDIPYSAWEKIFPFMHLLRILFIVSGWLLTCLLCYKKSDSKAI